MEIIRLLAQYGKNACLQVHASSVQFPDEMTVVPDYGWMLVVVWKSLQAIGSGLISCMNEHKQTVAPQTKLELCATDFFFLLFFQIVYLFKHLFSKML